MHHVGGERLVGPSGIQVAPGAALSNSGAATIPLGRSHALLRQGGGGRGGGRRTTESPVVFS